MTGRGSDAQQRSCRFAVNAAESKTLDITWELALNTSGSKSAKEIAVTALSLWDMNVEECEDESALVVAVAQGLIEFGLEPQAAANASNLVKSALAAHVDGSEAPAELASQPIFQAALEELQSGGWDFQ